MEDTGRDDMFVDCPDELSSVDVRQTDIKEETEAGENKDNLEKDQQNQFGEPGNGVGDGSVERTVAKEESIAQEYKVCCTCLRLVFPGEIYSQLLIFYDAGRKRNFCPRSA